MDRKENQTCRICNVSIADGDFVPLLRQKSDDCLEKTFSGELYEELMQLKCTIISTCPYVAICCSCDLQMKLFKCLKDKAWKVMNEICNTIVKGDENKIQNQGMHHSEHGVLIPANEKDLKSIVNNPTSLIKNETNEIQCDTEEIIVHNKNVENMDDIFVVYDDSQYNNQSEQNIEIDVDNVIEYNEISENVNANIVIEEQPEEYAEVECMHVISEHIVLPEKIVDEIKTKKDKPKRVRLKSEDTHCKDCSMNFDSIRLLKTHRQEKHGRTYLCKKCQKLFKTAENLESHMRKHLGLPAFSCDICQRSFNQKVHYQNHLKRHTSTRDFVCGICDKGFYNKSDLTIHMRTHGGERPLRCSYENCGKSFYNEQHLKYHSYVHSGEKNFECNLCNQKFVAPNALTTHLRTIHNEKQFACPKCDKRFRRKHILEVHMAAHSKDKSPEYMDCNEYYDNVSEIEIIDQEILLPDEQNDDENIINDDEEFFKTTIENCSETDNREVVVHKTNFKPC